MGGSRIVKKCCRESNECREVPVRGYRERNLVNLRTVFFIPLVISLQNMMLSLNTCFKRRKSWYWMK